VSAFTARAVAIVGASGLVLGAAACSGSPAPAPTSAASVNRKAALSFARCMRSHGVPNFPDPDAQGDFPTFGTGVSKQVSAAANESCKHLLPNGGGAGPQTRGDQQKLAFGLTTAQCMRKQGYPTYPDPSSASASGQGSGTRFEGTGIDTRSPRFQRTETACEQQARKALGLH
jgi:hypothetical protein